MDTQHGEVPSDALDHLRYEIDELQESRRRLVLAADAHRAKIERALHEGHVDRLDEMARDVQQALDEAARLSHLIDAPILDAGGLALALRTAAVTAGVPASVDVQAGYSCTSEVARTVYRCWREALDRAEDVTTSR